MSDIPVTPEEFFNDAEADLVEFGKQFDALRGFMPDDVVDGLQRANDRKLTEVRSAKRTIQKRKKR